MERLLYYVALGLVRLVQALPLPIVARLGRAGGALAWWLDARHRRVALQNLNMCFGHDKTPAQIRALARENFRRIGENFACAVKTAAMTLEELLPYCEFSGGEKLPRATTGAKPPTVVVAIGHFGNFELYARAGQFLSGYQCATTYRALRQPSLTRLLQSLRRRSGCLFFERRTEATLLKALMNQPGIMLGLLADQRAGRTCIPFLGHDCYTSTAPALFALRYRCPLYTAICYRVAPARWRIELGPPIPTHEGQTARPPVEIMRDVNRTFEAAVLRDPANWFWVHDRWKIRDMPETKTSKLAAPETASQATNGLA